MRRIGHVPQHQPVDRVRIVPSASAPLDARHRDVAAAERPVRGRVDDHVLGRRARRVLERRDPRRAGRVRDVDHRHAVVRRWWAEAAVAGRPVRKAPVTDVGVVLVLPHVGVEAADAEVVVPDELHVPGRTGLRPALKGLLRLIVEVLLVLQQVVFRRRRHGDSDKRQGAGGGEHDRQLAHPSPLSHGARPLEGTILPYLRHDHDEIPRKGPDALRCVMRHHPVRRYRVTLLVLPAGGGRP